MKSSEIAKGRPVPKTPAVPSKREVSKNTAMLIGGVAMFAGAMGFISLGRRLF